MTHLRLASAVIVGVLIAVLASYVALVILMLITIGLPLGAESQPLTTTQATALLATAAAAAGLGAQISARIARTQRRPAVAGVAAISALLMVWGFSGRNSWPDGWGIAVAISMVMGAMLSELIRGRPSDGRA